MKTLKKSAVLLLAISLAWKSQGQVVTIAQCYEAARINSPISRQTGLTNSIFDLTIKSLNNEKLPQVQINGQYTYQSDVVAFPEIGTFVGPDIPKNQYRASLDINQSIFQGNRIKHQIDIERANLKTDAQKVEVNLNSLKTQINAFYFSALLLQERKKIYETVIEDLISRIAFVHSLVNNGVLKSSSEKSLLIELKKAQQEKQSLSYQRTGILRMLNELTNIQLGDETELVIPEQSESLTLANNRPEVMLFEYQAASVNAQKSLASISRLPALFAFGSLGVGQPNPYNFFETDLSSFYVVGLKLSWTLWDWNKSSRTKQVLELQKEKINLEKENFELAVNTQLLGAKTNLEKLTDLVLSDKEILHLQSEITQDAFARFKQGVITATEYSEELNKETQAKLKLKLHQIQIAEENINILTITGNI